MTTRPPPAASPKGAHREERALRMSPRRSTPVPSPMLSPHHTRARLACERGQATVNWLAIMVGLTALAAALVLTLPAVAPKIACAFQNVVAKKARDAALDTNPITGLGRRSLGVGEDRPIPAPSIYGLEGGARIFGNAEGGAGPLSGKAEGEIGPSIGGRYDARTGDTTVYFKVNANAK